MRKVGRVTLEHEDIMPTLTPEQRQMVDQAIGRDGYARIDNYVVLKAEIYDHLRNLLDDGTEMSQVGSMVEAAMREYDLDDPLLEGYQRYRS
jgi:hypothetical protein